MCSTARGAVRNAKQKKTVPAKNSEAIFWRPRFTRPLRTGKRANANFACPEGFFCARRAAPSAGVGRSCAACRSCGGFCARCPGVFSASVPLPCSWLVAACCFCVWLGLACAACHELVCAGLLLPCLARRTGVQGGAAARRLCVRLPAGAPAFRGVISRPACLIAAFAFCLPCALCAHISLLSLSFFCLTSSSQNFFHLSLRPRRASTFFRKESRQRFARGAAHRAAPLRTPLTAPCDQSSLFPRCWPAYAAFQAANRRLTGKRLKSQGAKLSFSSVSVRRSSPAP